MNNEIDLNSVNVTESMNTDLVDIMSNVGKDIYHLCNSFGRNRKSPLADVCPVHKKDDYSYKKNYRAVSLLPIVSKVFERLLSNNIYSYIKKYLSTRLCGFRKDHSAQLSLIIMFEEIRKKLR